MDKNLLVLYFPRSVRGKTTFIGFSGLELASSVIAACTAPVLAPYRHRSLTSSVGLPKQAGHNAATEIILSGIVETPPSPTIPQF